MHLRTFFAEMITNVILLVVANRTSTIFKNMFTTTTCICSTVFSIVLNFCEITTFDTVSIFQYLFSFTASISTNPSLLIGVFRTLFASSIFQSDPGLVFSSSTCISSTVILQPLIVNLASRVYWTRLAYPTSSKILSSLTIDSFEVFLLF